MTYNKQHFSILVRYRNGEILRSYAYTLLAASGITILERDILLTAVDEGCELTDTALLKFIINYLRKERWQERNLEHGE